MFKSASMLEPIPCSSCGRSHIPGACPQETEDEKNLNPEQQEAIKESLIRALRRGWLDKVKEILDSGILPPDFIQSEEEFKEAVKENLRENLRNGWVNNVKEILDSGILPPDFIQSEEEFKEAAKEGLKKNLRNGYIYEVKAILDSGILSLDFIQSEEEVKEATKEGLRENLRNGYINNFKKILDLGILPSDFIQSEEVKEIAKEGLRESLKNSWINEAKEILDLGILPPEIDHINFSINSFVEKLNIKTWEELLRENQNNLSYLSWLIEHNYECFFNREDLNKIDQRVKITYPEAHVAKQNGIDIFTKDAGKSIYESIINNDELPEWQDEQNVSMPFQRGAEIFGYDKMFTYCQRQDLSRHDALHQLGYVIAMYESSNLSEKEFFGNILFQVNKDGARYDSGTAHHEFNHVAVNFNSNIEEILAQVKKYADVDKLQQLAQDLSSQEQIFASWKNLYKYYELCQLLKKIEILKDLQKLKQEGKAELYKYIETLAFHPNISMQAVLEFWRSPAKFLEIDDGHSQSAHENKKPSNYVEIPYLDLNAENLRDALVEGSLDELQVFQPFEIEYELPFEKRREQEPEKTIRTILREQLGYFDLKQNKRIPGSRKKPGDLIRLIGELLKENDIDFKEYIRNEEEQELSPEIQKQILQFLGMDNKKQQTVGQTIKYRAKINAKSDPEGVVAGNDTSCCMPFGSGKNNIYTFNPDCTIFTLQQQRPDNTWRTIAQSVLTKDVDIKENVQKVFSAMQDTNKPAIQDILPEDILTQSEFILACDNVEVTPNVRSNELITRQIEMIYQDFMFEYLSRYGERDNLRQEQVVIGKGFSDSLTNLPEVKNTYVPAAPVAYTDKSHSTVYSLTPQKIEDEIVSKKIIEYDSQQRDSYQSSQPGVSLLTFEDSLRVAFIEGKAYADNKTLIQHIHNMENGLIAKDINNQQKDRPNMSFKYEDKNKKMQGYIFAYEGVVGNEKMIYVTDIAVNEKGKGAGLALMIAFLERYKIEYLANNNPLPIYAQMREQTSYSMIKSKLSEFSRLLGVKLDLEEHGTYRQGEDIMHEVVIRVK